MADENNPFWNVLQQIERLQFAVSKMSKWSGVEIGELIDEGYLKEGDMD